MENITDIFNLDSGINGITEHACSSTEGWIGWIICISIWLIIFFIINRSDENNLAVGSASFVSLIFAIGFLIFGCGGGWLVMLMTILTTLGITIGFLKR